MDWRVEKLERLGTGESTKLGRVNLSRFERELNWSGRASKRLLSINKWRSEVLARMLSGNSARRLKLRVNVSRFVRGAVSGISVRLLAVRRKFLRLVRREMESGSHWTLLKLRSRCSREEIDQRHSMDLLLLMDCARMQLLRTRSFSRLLHSLREGGSEVR